MRAECCGAFGRYSLGAIAVSSAERRGRAVIGAARAEQAGRVGARRPVAGRASRGGRHEGLGVLEGRMKGVKGAAKGALGGLRALSGRRPAEARPVISITPRPSPVTGGALCAFIVVEAAGLIMQIRGLAKDPLQAAAAANLARRVISRGGCHGTGRGCAGAIARACSSVIP